MPIIMSYARSRWVRWGWLVVWWCLQSDHIALVVFFERIARYICGRADMTFDLHSRDRQRRLSSHYDKINADADADEASAHRWSCACRRFDPRAPFPNSGHRIWRTRSTHRFEFFHQTVPNKIPLYTHPHGICNFHNFYEPRCVHRSFNVRTNRPRKWIKLSLWGGQACQIKILCVQYWVIVPIIYD